MLINKEKTTNERRRTLHGDSAALLVVTKAILSFARVRSSIIWRQRSHWQPKRFAAISILQKDTSTLQHTPSRR